VRNATTEAVLDWKCCWTKEGIEPEDCPYVAEGETELRVSLKKRVVEKCLECFRFRDDLQTFRDERHPLSQILPYIVEEYHTQKSQLQSMASFLDSKKTEIRFLHELTVVLQTSMDLDEVLSVAMTAITAGKGFGMNRAFLLLADKERRFLEGYLGVGPKDYEEAWQTWEDINRKNFSLQEMAKNFYDTRLSSEKTKFQDILSRLTVSLEEADHILNRSLRDRKPILVDPQTRNDSGLRDTLKVESFLIMPLISRSRRIGVILADNYVTKKPITPQDMQSMETFAFAVAFAIERTSLYEQLQEKVDKLTAANQKLKEQQELIVKMEKMALVGKITSSIAHSIRNPLMVIGGFARSLAKNVAADDPNREYLDSIVREAKQLDEVLEEVLTYSDSLYPVVDLWDVNHLVSKIFNEFADRLQSEKVLGELDLAQDLPAAFIDYRQISFCLRNVLNSIIGSVGKGGRLVVSTLPEPGTIALRLSARTPGKASGKEATPPENGFDLTLCGSLLEKQRIGYTIDDEKEERSLTMHLPMERGQ
jgi:signal transduction histidine kinase